MKKIISATLVMFGFILGATALSALAGTWTVPTCDPSVNPGACNVDAPINVGSSLQQKLGALWLRSGLAIDGNLVISTSTSASTAGKVLTAVDNAGTVGWKALATADSTAFCNYATAPTNTQVPLSLIKNGVNMCSSGCVLKVLELWSNNAPGAGAASAYIYHFYQFADTYSMTQPQSTVVTFSPNMWSVGATQGKNGDGVNTNIYTGIAGQSAITDDSAVENSPDQVTLVGGVYGSLRVGVCSI